MTSNKFTTTRAVLEYLGDLTALSSILTSRVLNMAHGADVLKIGDNIEMALYDGDPFGGVSTLSVINAVLRKLDLGIFRMHRHPKTKWSTESEPQLSTLSMDLSVIKGRLADPAPTSTEVLAAYIEVQKQWEQHYAVEARRLLRTGIGTDPLTMCPMSLLIGVLGAMGVAREDVIYALHDSKNFKPLPGDICRKEIPSGNL